MLVAAPRHRDGCRLAASSRRSTPPARAPGAPAPPPRSSRRGPWCPGSLSTGKGQDAPRRLADVGDIGVDAVDPAQHVASRNGRWSARCPLNARPTSFCCFTWINGVDLSKGSTADQGRTGSEDSSSRPRAPARAPATHAKQGPSTGHSAVGSRQAGEMSPDAEAAFTAPSSTLGNEAVRAPHGSPFRQERRPTRVQRQACRPGNR